MAVVPPESLAYLADGESLALAIDADIPYSRDPNREHEPM